MITPLSLDIYRDTRLPSYSLLSSLDSGHFNYVRDYIGGEPLDEYNKKRSKAKSIGSYVDALLFYDTTYIENNFYILSSNYSEGLYTKFVGLVVKAIYEHEVLKDEIPEEFNQVEPFINEIDDNYRALLFDCYTIAGFKINYAAVLAKIRKEYLQFMFESFRAYGKTTLSVDEALISDNTVTAIKSSYTGHYFQADPRITLLTQIGFTFPFFTADLSSQTVKVLPDIIEVDNYNKWIRGVDVKTREGSAYNFRYDFLKWKYYLQSALYTKALYAWLEAAQEKGKYKDYTVNDNFRFVVGSKDIFNSCIFECTAQDIMLGMEGFTKKDGTVVRGVNQLMYDLNWHIEHNYWETPRDIIESNGVRQLNLLDKL